MRFHGRRSVCAPALFENGLFSETLILTLRSSNPLPLGSGCESRINHYLVDRVPRLGDDKLQTAPDGELLQALAWDIKGDDTIRASVRRNGDLQNFMVLQIFLDCVLTSPQVFKDPTPPLATIGLAAMARLFTIAHSVQRRWGIDS